MPFLRVIRDKRGYETTYLMHWFREGNRQRSRILYVFRTPGGVRVGRTPLEPEVLRHIETEYPDIEFDWSIIRENQQVVEPTVEQQRRRRSKREESETAAPAPAPAPAEAAPPPPPPAPAVAAEPQQPPIPPTLQGTTPDEQIAFLNEWYPIVRDRVPRKTSDPARQEALLALAERLNPTSWTDADQITSGLQEAAQALERLSHVFARRRRRSRRRPAGPRPAAPPPVVPES